MEEKFEEDEERQFLYYLVECYNGYEGPVCVDDINEFLDELDLLDNYLEPTYDINDAIEFYDAGDAIYAYIASFDPKEYEGLKNIEVLKMRVNDVIDECVLVVEYDRFEDTYTLLGADDVADIILKAFGDICKFEQLHDTKHPLIKNIIDKHESIMKQICDLNTNVINVFIHFGNDENGHIDDTELTIINKNSIYYKNDKDLHDIGKEYWIGDNLITADTLHLRNFVVNNLMATPQQACGYTIHKANVDCDVDAFSEDYKKKIYYKIYACAIVKDENSVKIEHCSAKRLSDNLVETKNYSKLEVKDEFIYCNLSDENDIVCGFDLL